MKYKGPEAKHQYADIYMVFQIAGSLSYNPEKCYKYIYQCKYLSQSESKAAITV